MLPPSNTNKLGMKKFLTFIILCNLFVSLQAGGIKRPAVKTVRPKNVAQASRIAQQRLQRKLYRIPRLATTTASKHKMQSGHPLPYTFQIQRFNDLEAETASAFAIRLFGKPIGVTAGHVMNSVRKAPYIKIQEGAQTVLAPIQKFIIGNSNSNGLDLAIFEIPQEILPHVTVLEPSARAPITGEYLNIPGFADGKAFFVPQERVLITTPTKLLLQKTATVGLRGFCGSPILGKNNKVQAIYIGFVNKEILPNLRWVNDLPREVTANMPAFHIAIPVQALSDLVELAETGVASKTGTMMYALGHPVGLLKPTEFIKSIELFRRGKKIGSIQYNPLIDPGHLEQFFELQENDVLRLTINQSTTSFTQQGENVLYDVNVSTGEVTVVTP